MTLQRLVVYVVMGSALAGWFFQSPASVSAPAAVEIARPCLPATRQWAEEWRRSWTGPGDLRRLSVLCQPDGTVTATSISRHSGDGHQFLAWRPLTTFGGILPPFPREQIDVVDGRGRLLQYLVLDRDAERVDFYDAASARTAYGRFDPSSGRVERFSLVGRPQGAVTLPIPPRAAGRRG